MTLTQAIKAAKFDWVNEDIESYFSYRKPRNADYKLFDFDYEISSVDAVSHIEKEGYNPATVSELLAYAKDGWDGEDWVVALGSVAEFCLVRSVVGLNRHGAKRRVPFLGRGGADRSLGLRWWGSRWLRHDRFLAVRMSSASSPSATLSLEAHVTRLEEVMKE